MVDRDSTRADLIAGLTGALIVLPQGVAFATIAGMPPEYGLYAAMLPAVIAALFGCEAVKQEDTSGDGYTRYVLERVKE